MARPTKKKYKYLGSRPGVRHPVLSNRFSPISGATHGQVVLQSKKWREEMEKEILRRKLERFRRQEMRSRRALPPAAPVDTPYPIDHGQGDFPRKGAEMNERGMAARQWVMPQDKRKMLQQQAIARDLAEREAEQLELQNRRPTPETWMTGRLGLQDPTWTSKAPGVDAQQAANMAQARRRELNLAAPGLEGQVFDDDRPTGGEIQAGVQGLLGQYPENVSGAVPDYGYLDRRKHTLQQRQREKDFTKSQRDQAIAFEQMEPTQPSYAQRSIAKIFGLPMAGTAAIINPLLKLLGAPEDIIASDAPMSEAWILQRLQTTSPIAVNKIKDQLAKVYPAVVKADKAVSGVVDDTVEHWRPGVEGVIDDTTQYWGDKAQSAAEAVGVDSASQIPGQLINDALMYYSEAPGDQIKSDIKSAGSALLDTVKDVVVDPTMSSDLVTEAGDWLRPKTIEMGRKYEDWRKRKISEQHQDDPWGLLGPEKVEEEDSLLGQQVDVTNVAPSERPRSGTGFPGPGLGRPSAVTTAEKQKKQIVKGVDPNASTVGGDAATQLDPATRAGLERVWGKHTYKPAQRRKKYMAQLNSIYKKAAWLDAIAAVSGGQSRSSSYIDRAVGMMDAMQKFDQEERVYNIWRDVYYTKDGKYDPPKSKKDAAERARRLGANPEEVKAIYGWAEEDKDLQQWYRDDGKGDYETTTIKGKKTRPKGEGWIMGKPPTPRTPAKKQYIWAIPPGQTEAVYMDKDVVASQQGWTQSTIDKSGGLYGQSLRQAAQHLDDGDEDKARAVLKQFYSRDLIQAGLFSENIDTVIDSLIESIRISSGADPATKYASKQEAYAAVMGANPKPAGMSQADYEKRIAARAETVWKEQQ